MFRMKFVKYLADQSLGSICHSNVPRCIHKNTIQYISSLNYSVDIKESQLSYKSHENFKVQGNSKKLPDKEFLVQLKSDPNRFGSQEQEFEDEGDLQEEKYLSEKPLPSQRLSIKRYADIIKSFIERRKLKEAIDFVEVRMIKQDRVKPGGYIYNLLLGACGRVGYTKKAFMLYNDMKRRGFKVTGGTYTALFNACANSPWPQTDGLTRAKHLHEILIETGHEPNDTTYNAMIKAFGRCGDIATSFQLVDEMMAKGLPLTDATITFLLQACVTDKEAGFRHALLVWRKVVDKKLQPNIFIYNTFLRTIRDCGLGDIEITKDVFKQIIPSNNVQLLLNSSVESNTKPVTDTNDSDNQINETIINEEEKLKNAVSEVKENHIGIMSDHSSCTIRPNLMSTVPHLGNLISLSEVKNPEDRLLLVGGFKGFLDNMYQHKCKPDIKTFTQLLASIPGSLAAEQELLAALKKHNVKPDIDFYNMLMYKRSRRTDYEGAKVSNYFLLEYYNEIKIHLRREQSLCGTLVCFLIFHCITLFLKISYNRYWNSVRIGTVLFKINGSF